MLRTALPADAPELTRIAFAAKRHWNYPEDWIARWSGELTITPDYLAAHRVRCWWEGDRLVGFYSMVRLGEDCQFGAVSMEKGWWLDHMFIDPGWHAQGIGRRFFADIDEWLAGDGAAGLAGMRIFVDPHASGFYEKMGTRLVRHSDSSIPERQIPVHGYQPVLRTSRLAIRLVAIGDAPALFELYSRPEICDQIDHPPYRELVQAEAQLERWLRLAGERKQFRWALLREGRLIGTAGLYDIYWHQNRAMLGYDLRPEYWGQGLMDEALSCLIPRWSAELGIRRLQATVLPGNTASAGLLVKLGFEREGLLRSYENWGDKGFVDLQIFARVLTHG